MSLTQTVEWQRLAWYCITSAKPNFFSRRNRVEPGSWHQTYEQFCENTQEVKA